HTALYDFLVSPMNNKKRAIIGTDHRTLGDTQYPSEASGARTKVPHSLRSGTVSSLESNANASQAEAIERAVNCDVYHLIWGPPGTGKTRVIPEIVRRVPGTVLLGAFTNTAVDKMLLSLLDTDPDTRFIRFGRSSESPELEARLRSIG